MGRSWRLKSKIASWKLWISQFGWSWRPIFSSFNERSLKSPKIHQGVKTININRKTRVKTNQGSNLCYFMRFYWGFKEKNNIQKISSNEVTKGFNCTQVSQAPIIPNEQTYLPWQAYLLGPSIKKGLLSLEWGEEKMEGGVRVMIIGSRERRWRFGLVWFFGLDGWGGKR